MKRLFWLAPVVVLLGCGGGGSGSQVIRQRKTLTHG